MGKLRKFFILFFIIGLLTVLKGECQQSTFRLKKIVAHGSYKLDSLSILPNSVYIYNCDTSFYYVDYLKATIFWKKAVSNDSIIITFRVIPYTLNKVVYRYNYDSIKNRFLAGNKIIINKGASNLEEYFGGRKINYSGSVGRNMSFGNTQDATFNSEFNLQINGLIGDSIQLTAAITDNNIPIQPDGNTKQLNEFDKILVQFKKKDWELNLGDVDIKEKQSYFLNFYKRSQGIYYKQQNITALGTKQSVSIGGGIAKGKFNRNIFLGLEGNQGPYKLQGANNELFFVILSNTEKVTIDGETLQRGIDQDYTINYNTAEITFTSKRLITKDKRIQVEFEYADKNYLNYLAFAEDNIDINKQLKVSIAAYNNNDVASSPINQTLDNNQKSFLNKLGDSVSYAFYPAGTKDSFTTSQIMYKKIDTLYNGTHDSIYVYSTNPDSARYTLNFVYAGNNKGNYIPYYNAANGKVYQWVAPFNGIPQGDYEAAIFLVTPKSQQLLSIKTDYLLNKKTSFITELAGSRYDLNTLSSKDKQNDYGFAGKATFNHSNKYKNNSHLYNYTIAASYEYLNINFKPIEVLKSSEFYRDWGLNLVSAASSEQLTSTGIQLRDEKNNAAEYTIKDYIRSDGYKGIMQQLKIFKVLGSWKVQSFVQYTSNTTPNLKGDYFKPSIDIQKSFKEIDNITIGGNFYLENNKQKYRSFDSMALNSFAFSTYTLSIKSNSLLPNKWSLSYTERTNKIPIGNMVLNNDISSNYTFAYELMKNKKHQLRINATYRELQQLYGLTKGSKENTILGRAEYIFNEVEGTVKGNMVYEIGNGQEQKKDLSYVQVPSGKGQYVWNDYNHDGIQQLNEFEIAQFVDQANYVRVYTPTNDYTKSNYTLLGYNLQITPYTKSIARNNLMKFARKMSLQSSLQSQTKTLYDGNLQFNPFKNAFNDTSIIQNNYSWNNTLSINRYGTWGIDAGRNSSYNKALLTYGLESSRFIEYTFRGRFNIKQKVLFEMIQKFSDKSLSTPSFNNRNYSLTGFSSEPRITYSTNTKWRIITYYQYSNNQNKSTYGGEQAISNSLSVESKLNLVQNAGINIKFSSNTINYLGIANSTVSYVMLNGLQPGKNYLWNIEFTKRLMNSLEISFNYEGRKAGESKTVNIGRASVRAIL